jgi:hypothetical protein
MKKNLLFTLSVMFLLSTAAKSQSLQISDNSGTLANGTILHVWGDSSYLNIMKVYLTVKNISTGSVTVKSKKIENSLVPGAEVLFCFHGNCFPSTIFTSLTQSTLAPNAHDTTFTGEYKPDGQIGESIVTFVFFNVANINDSAWVIVHFHSTVLGYNNFLSSNTTISNPYPNPASNFTSFNYTLPNTSDKAKLVLTNILGSVIKEINITGDGKLTINTSDLNDEVYFYSFFVNDRLIQTKKLIIQH